MAEFVFLHLLKKRGLEGEFTVASRATSTEEIGNDVHRGTRKILDKYGIPYSSREATELSRSDYPKYDYIVGMDSANIRNMNRIFGGDPDRRISMLLDHTGEYRDVADPWYTGNFELTYFDVLRGCEALLDKALEDIKGK